MSQEPPGTRYQARTYISHENDFDTLWMPLLPWWAGCTPYRRPPFQGIWGWWLCARSGWSFLLPEWHAQCCWWLYGCCHCRCAWGKFRENLPLLTSKPVPFDLRGRLFSSNVRSSMLHGMETWPMTSDALHRLCRNDRAMIRWICGVKPSDDQSMDNLHAKIGICDLMVSTDCQKKIQALFQGYFRSFQGHFQCHSRCVAIKKYRVTWENLEFVCNLPSSHRSLRMGRWKLPFVGNFFFIEMRFIYDNSR